MIFNRHHHIEISEPSEPTMYLYGRVAAANETVNAYIGEVGYVGAVLPPLPARDKVTYPYACMFRLSSPGPLYFSTNPLLYKKNKYETGIYIGENITTTLQYGLRKGAFYGPVEYTGNPGKSVIASSDTSYDFSPFWSNYDLYNVDGSLHCTATDPIPVQLVAYSYNGVELPALPEWDKEKYPYAHLFKLNRNHYMLYITKEINYAVSGDNFNLLHKAEDLQYSKWTSDTTWGEPYILSTQSGTAHVTDVIWANFDVVDETGDVVLSATEPIPIYE